MRIPTYLSYSAYAKFQKDIEEFFISYLADTRAPRTPQEKPASVGSGFDARVKSSLHAALFGEGSDPKYTFEALFEQQVEAHNRDWCLDESKYIFDCYKVSGAYDRLLELLKKAIEPPRFEFDIRAEILGGVPFLGKPDCRFVLPGPYRIVHDWKVNGYCSKSAVSPNKGYMICCDGFVAAKQNKNNGLPHKNFVPNDLGSIAVDVGYMEDSSSEWADQLTLYGWVDGEKVGDEKVVLSVDQIVAKPLPVGRPLLRVASFRARVRKSYQEFLAKQVKAAWDVITSGHIFRDLSREESDQRVAMLTSQALSLQTDGSPTENFFNEVVRPAYRGK